MAALNDQLYDQLEDQLWGQLRVQLSGQLWNQLRGQLGCSSFTCFGHAPLSPRDRIQGVSSSVLQCFSFLKFSVFGFRHS